MSKKLFVSLFMILISILLLLGVLFVNYFFEERVSVLEDGQIVINENLKDNYYLRLSGNWLFYPEEIITSRNEIQDKSYTNYLKVPKPWSVIMYGRKYPEKFYGTYYLQMIFPEEMIGEDVSLLVSGLMTNSQIYVDGKKIFGEDVIDNEKVNLDSEIVEFTIKSKEHELFIPVVNRVANKGGMTHSLIIGNHGRIQIIYFSIIIVQFVIIGMAILLLIFYSIQILFKKQKIVLKSYMAVLMVFIIIKLLFGQNLLIYKIFNEISYHLVYRINYMSIVLIILLIYLISNRFFEFEKNNKNKRRIISITALVLTFLFLVLPINLIFEFSIIFILLTFTLGLVAIYDSFKAYMNKKLGGLLFFSSLISIITAFIYDELIIDRAYNDVYLMPLSLFIVTILISYLEIDVYEQYAEKNIELYEEKERLSLDIISALVFAIDARDEYTQGHSQRVKKFSLGTGMELGLSKKELEKLEYMALLHDVGKIGISDSILKKPENLSEEEYKRITRHPIIGEKILSQVESLNAFIEGVKYHHERYDGSGYPSGLRGKQIPLMARIIAIADSYDAMMSNREYAKKRTKNQTLEEIKNNSGILYDPEVVEAFIRYMTRVEMK